MYGQVDRLTDGQTDRWMNIHKDIRICRHMYGQTDRWTNRQTDGWKDRQIGGKTDRLRSRHKKTKMTGCL